MANQNEQSIAGIVKELTHDISRLVTGEIALLKTEIKGSLARAGAGAGLLSAAGVTALFAAACLLAGLILGLIAAGIRPWLAATLVGVFLAVVAAVLGLTGKKKVETAGEPAQHAIERAKSDFEAVKNDVKHIGGR